MAIPGLVLYSGSSVLLRDPTKVYPTISYGKGMYLYDTSGKQYIDASGGALASSVGHGKREITRFVAAQMNRVAYVNGTQFTSEVVEELAAELINLAPEGIERAFFLSSGSEATEAAIKFARQIWFQRGQTGRRKIIARTPGYHGNTLYALSASARPHYKTTYGPLLSSDIVMIDAPYAYRSPVDYQQEGGAHYAKLLEEAIQREGPETIMAFMFETVIGSSAGASVPPPDYFARVQEICRRHGILMIADEVMCGSGRTGRFFASEHFGLKPDIITMGKGISSSYVPLSAVLVRGSLADEIHNPRSKYAHAQTHMQHPVAAAAGLAVVRYMKKHGLIENADKMGQYFQSELRRRLSPLPHVGHVGGIGLMAGVEFVYNKETKAPFPRQEKFVEHFIAAAFEAGLIVWPNTGQADETNGDLVMLGPPLTIKKRHADEIIDLFESIILSLT